MPERLNGPVSKTGVGATLPGVQIPLSPPLINKINQSQSAFDFALHGSRHRNFFLSLRFLASNAVFFYHVTSCWASTFILFSSQAHTLNNNLARLVSLITKQLTALATLGFCKDIFKRRDEKQRNQERIGSLVCCRVSAMRR